MEFRCGHALLGLLVLGRPFPSRHIYISLDVDLRLHLRSVLRLLRPSNSIFCTERTPGIAVRTAVLPVHRIILRRGCPVYCSAIVCIFQLATAITHSDALVASGNHGCIGSVHSNISWKACWASSYITCPSSATQPSWPNFERRQVRPAKAIWARTRSKLEVMSLPWAMACAASANTPTGMNLGRHSMFTSDMCGGTTAFSGRSVYSSKLTLTTWVSIRNNVEHELTHGSIAIVFLCSKLYLQGGRKVMRSVNPATRKERKAVKARERGAADEKA